MSTTLLQNGIRGAATIGKIYAVIGFITSLFIALLIIAVAFYLISSGRKHSVPLQATITSASKSTLEQSKLDLSYNYQDKTLTKTIETPFDALYAKDAVVTIYANPVDPHDITVNKPPVAIGYVLLIVALLIVVGTSVHLYLTFHYKGFAAVAGAADVVGVLRNAGRG